MNTDFRNQFPSLSRIHNGQPLIFLDGPAGVQVPERVIDAVSNYYRRCNANTHGQFVTTQETDEIMHNARHDVAVFLGAEDWTHISFGQNMTTLNFALSKAIARVLTPGDEILVTQLDHEANRGPWLALRENGIVVKEIKLKKTGCLDYNDMEHKLNDRTRLVAMGYASNMLGTVNDVALARKITYEAGAWLLLDAVHYAPHFALDVQALGCDFLLCSAYKFYGPHVGILYARTGLLDRLQPDRLRTTTQTAPFSIETGTLNHAAIAGVQAAVQFIAGTGQGDTLRDRITSAMLTIRQHERQMFLRLYEGLSAWSHVKIVGPNPDAIERAPTLAITVDNKSPQEVCSYLAQHNICAWDGHFYAIRAAEVLGLLERGGVTRLGISAYTLPEEVDRAVEVIGGIR